MLYLLARCKIRIIYSQVYIYMKVVQRQMNVRILLLVKMPTSFLLTSMNLLSEQFQVQKMNKHNG